MNFSALSSATHRILAVDDVPANLLILEELLGDDYELVCCESGDKALELAPAMRPDLILLDIMMPGIDGYETCRQLRAMRELEATKIIMVSAKARVEDRLKGYEVGANDYLSKPFDHGELLAKVNVYLQLKSVEEVNLAKTRVIEVLQHSGRTPLTPIIGNAELLAMDDGITDEMRVTLANSIHRCGNRLLKLFAKAEHWAELVSGTHQMSFQKMTLGDLIHQVDQELKSNGEPPIHISVEDVSTAEIHGDLSELQNALSAILNNALRFSPADSTVNLTARVVADSVEIAIKDEGPGFPREALGKEFQPFVNPEAVLHNQGDGLNLAICAEVARYHLGELIAANDPDGGAAISLRLPLAAHSVSLIDNAINVDDFSNLGMECTL